MNPKNSELSLQFVYVDKQILVVCTGSSGEAYSFIKESDVEVLIKKSILVHQHIDKFFPKDSTSVESNNHAIKQGVATKDANSPVSSDTKISGNSVLNSKQEREKLSSNLRQLGTLLFKNVFKNQILDLLNVAIGQAIILKNDVLIRLMIASDFLNLVPWELFYNEDRYLCHVYDIVRHPFTLQPVRKPMPSSENIRLLFIGANPSHDIYVQGQIEAVQAALEESSIQFEKLPDSTYKSIANSIYDGITILHFLAHGECEYDGNHLKYHFRVDSEDENKPYDKLPIEMLESFCRANPMQIAVLNACRSDQAVIYSKSKSIKKLISRLSEFSYYSMAHALIKTGIPCVIGMSHPISKIGAEILTRRLYRTLTSKGGSPYKAIRQIRLELFAHTDFLPPSDWLTPVLYLRDSNNNGFIQSK
jgi:hypothetical protein